MAVEKLVKLEYEDGWAVLPVREVRRVAVVKISADGGRHRWKVVIRTKQEGSGVKVYIADVEAHARKVAYQLIDLFWVHQELSSPIVDVPQIVRGFEAVVAKSATEQEG